MRWAAPRDERIRQVLTLLALAADPVAVTRFAPPIDQPLLVVMTDTREDPGRRLTFEIRRRVTFHRTGDALTAEVDTLSVSEDASHAGAMFTAMMRAMIGRRVLLRLDTAGRVVDVDDLDTQWAARTRGIEAGLATVKLDARRRALVAPIVAALQSAPRAERITRLAEMLGPLVPDIPVRADSRRAITQPGRAFDGSATTLSGTEATRWTDTGMIAIDHNLTGSVGGLALDRSHHRQIDPATGLVRESVETMVTATPAGPAKVVRTLRSSPLVS